MKAKLEILALVLGFIGLAGTIAATALPTWKVSAFIGANLIVMETYWEGLWMVCYRQIDIKMQCKAWDSELSLPVELQASRGLMCVSMALALISLIITGFGIQKGNCYGDNMRNKNIILAFGGSLYLISFLTTLIPVSWVGHSIIKQFYNPTVLDAQKHELGQSLYIGWATSGIFLATGIILLVRYSKRTSQEEEIYPEGYPMTDKDSIKQDSVYLQKSAASFHRHQEYV